MRSAIKLTAQRIFLVSACFHFSLVYWQFSTHPRPCSSGDEWKHLSIYSFVQCSADVRQKIFESKIYLVYVLRKIMQRFSDFLGFERSSKCTTYHLYICHEYKFILIMFEIKYQQQISVFNWNTIYCVSSKLLLYPCGYGYHSLRNANTKHSLVCCVMGSRLARITYNGVDRRGFS